MRNMMLNAAVGLAVFGGTITVAHATPWRVEVLEHPGTVAYDLDGDRPQLTTTSDGSLLAYPLSMRIRDDLDDDGYTAFARIGSTGATASFSTGTVGAYAKGTLLADGSLVTVATTIDRVASDGTVIWSILNPLGVDFGRVVQMSSDALLLAIPAGSQLKLRGLSLDNGAVTQSLDLPITPSGYCYSVGMVGGDNGSAFIGDPCVSSGIIKVLESPLRLDSNWQPTPAITAVRDIRFDGGALYAAVQSDNRAVLRKFNPTTGATLWTYPDSGSEFGVSGQFDVLGGVVLVRALNASSDTVIQRIDPATGALLWSYTSTRNVFAAAAAGNGLVLGSGVGSIIDLDDARGFIEGINLATGAFTWDATLAAPQGGGSFLSSIAIQGSQAVAIGAGCPAITVNGRPTCDVTLWRYDLSTGIPVEPAAPVKVRTGNNAVAFVEPPPSQPIAATLEMGSAGPQLHIRKFALSDGATKLDIVTPVQMTYPWQLPEFARVIPTGDGNYAALLSIFPRNARDSDAVVMKINGSNGAVLWRRSLIDYSLGPQDIDLIQITSDSAGSIFFDVAHDYQWTGRAESIVKLASTTGNVSWEVSVPNSAISLFNSGIVQMLGDDVLVYSDPTLLGGAGWQRRRGSDGSVVWSAASLPVFPNVVSDAVIYGTSFAGNALTLARIDPLTGATLCSGTHVSSDDSSLRNGGWPLLASDGDIYLAAQRKTGTVFKAIVVKFSGSTCNPIWANRLDATTSPGAQFTPRFVDSGVFYFSGRPSSYDAISANFLTAVSSTDGSLINSQLLYQAGWQDRSSVRAAGGPLGLDSSGELLLFAASREPGQPTRTVVEKRASPASAVTGSINISASMVAAPAPASAGFDFVISVVNDGAITAPNVRTLANFGIDVRLDNVTCSLAGSPCDTSIVGSTIRFTSNIAAGSTLTLTGRASVPAASTSQISLTGSALSPYGFAEINLADNILTVMAPFRDQIFRNGFESTP